MSNNGNSNSTSQRPSTPTDWRTTHLWQLQPVRDVLLLAAVLGVLYVGSIISIVTVPLLLALLLAYLFEPLVRWLVRRRFLSRAGAAMAIIVLASAVIVVPVILGAGFAAVKTAALASNIADRISIVQKSIAKPDDAGLRESIPEGGWRAVRDYLVELGEEEPGAVQQPGVEGGELLTKPMQTPRTSDDSTRRRLGMLVRQGADWVRANAEQIGETLGKRVLGSGAEAVTGAVGAAFGLATSLGMLVFSGFLTAIFFYAFCTGYGKVQEFWESLIPERRKARTVELLTRMDRVIAGFVRGRLTIVGILMLWMTFAYAMIGVPAWYLLGPIVGALFIVPFVHIIGVPMAMLLMWLEPGSMLFDFQQNWWWIVFAPIGVYLASQALDDYVLSPVIQGKNTGMDMPTILFASIAGGALAGVYGLLIAIPVAACIKILLKEVFWPRFTAWAQGKEKDFLPIERG